MRSGRGGAGVSAGSMVGAACASPWRAAMADWSELAKVRLNTMVLISAATGFALGSAGAVAWPRLAAALAGIGSVAAGAAVLNQYLERKWDALMLRTRDRPLPAGRVAPVSALAAGITLSAGGVGYLAVAVNLPAAALAASTLGVYLFVYTPMKRWSSLNTVVGAVPGAMPPVLGWAAASGGVDAGAWVLFLVLFLWQMPHFLAIAWLWRADYARAGFRMLPVVRPDGRSTGGWAAAAAFGLVAVGLPALGAGLTGPVFALGAAVPGLAFFAMAWRFARRRGDAEARVLFLSSLCYLPLVLAWLAAGAGA